MTAAAGDGCGHAGHRGCTSSSTTWRCPARTGGPPPRRARCGCGRRAVTVADGHGRWRPPVDGDGEVEPVGDVVADPAPSPPLTVASPGQGRSERARRAEAHRAGRRPDRPLRRRADGRPPRRRRRSAAPAPRRDRPPGGHAVPPDPAPRVEPVATFAAAAALPGAALADAAGGPPSLARPTVLVGPEGGWSPAERETGLPTIRLGPHTLRAETAAITACAILAALRDSSVAEVARDDTPGGVPPVEGS